MPLLEQVAAEHPTGMPVLEALADVRERQAARRRRRWRCASGSTSLRTPTPAELVQLGELAMEAGNTPVAH